MIDETYIDISCRSEIELKNDIDLIYEILESEEIEGIVSPYIKMNKYGIFDKLYLDLFGKFYRPTFEIDGIKIYLNLGLHESHRSVNNFIKSAGSKNGIYKRVSPNNSLIGRINSLLGYKLNVFHLCYATNSINILIRK